MADTLQFDLVSPERKLASVAASQVQIPGVAGDLTALPNHAPFLTTLRPGLIRVTAGGQVSEFLVTGGFAEVSPEAVTVLAERAIPRSEITADMLQSLQSEADKAASEATEETRIAANLRVNDVKFLRAQLSL